MPFLPAISGWYREPTGPNARLHICKTGRNFDRRRLMAVAACIRERVTRYIPQFQSPTRRKARRHAAAKEAGRLACREGKRVIDNPYTAGDPRRPHPR